MENDSLGSIIDRGLGKNVMSNGKYGIPTEYGNGKYTRFRASNEKRRLAAIKAWEKRKEKLDAETNNTNNVC